MGKNLKSDNDLIRAVLKAAFRLRPLTVCLLCALFPYFCSSSYSFAGQQRPGEYQVKAAFIYNFINFVDWPAESFGSSKLNICIAGEDPFGRAFDSIKNETIRGKKLAVRPFRFSEESRGCQIVFIAASERKHTGRILKSIGNANVLTVSDTAESVKQGVMIGFFIENDKVRFAINNTAAKRAGLKISAKLLKLAKIISPEE